MLFHNFLGHQHRLQSPAPPPHASERPTPRILLCKSQTTPTPPHSHLQPWRLICPEFFFRPSWHHQNSTDAVFSPMKLGWLLLFAARFLSQSCLGSLFPRRGPGRGGGGEVGCPSLDLRRHGSKRQDLMRKSKKSTETSKTRGQQRWGTHLSPPICMQGHGFEGRLCKHVHVPPPCPPAFPSSDFCQAQDS